MGILESANSLLLGAPAAAGGYTISRSLRFNSADSAYLSRTPASAGNRKTWTWAGWVKRSKLGDNLALFGRQQSDDTNTLDIRFGTGDTLRLANFNTYILETTQVFRDVSAWFHLVVVLDTTQATANNRARMYVNGVEITQFGARNNPTQNADLAINNTTLHHLGATVSGGSVAYPFSGYLADIHFIDGQALTPSSFGEFDTNNVWQPKAYSGSYGTNGFRLPFSDNSAATATTLGKDTSGLGNNWTPNNLSVTAGAGNDSLRDSPSSPAGQTDSGAGGTVVGNYCTWNPLDNGGVTLSNGNLDAVTASVWKAVRGTIGVSSGKWYWEYTMTAAGYTMIGVVTGSGSLSTYTGAIAPGYAYYSLTGNKWNNGSSVAYGSTFTAGDVIGVAFDAGNGKLWFSKNGTWQASGDPAAGTNAAYSSIPADNYFPTVSQDNTNGATGGALNAGSRPFAYTAPSGGFKALCTANLPTPTIANGATAMDVKLYTGNGSSQTISGLNFSPDLVWIKARSQGTDWHALFNTIVGPTKRLFSNSTAAEATNAQTLTAFNSDGFSVGNTSEVNGSSTTYVAWTWDAGSSTVTNTAGSITSSVRASASSGFSVVTYTGNNTTTPSPMPTVGHGLNIAPSLIISKSRNNAGVESGNWFVWHTGAGTGNWLRLNTTDAAGSISSSGGGAMVAPTSTVFSTPYISGSNISGNNYVAYCFAPVAGYSSFGSYTGNGSADGAFVYTGFRPRYVLQKKTSDVSAWAIRDAARDPYNAATARLWTNFSSAESSADAIDLLSNGFKVRNTDTDWNANGATYIYAAFAESPFAYARAR